MNEEPGGISLKVSARRAYEKMDALERALNKLVGRRIASGAKIKETVASLRKKTAEAVSLSVELTYAELIVQTPKQTKFLVSNWKLSQGRDPSLGALLERPSGISSFALPLPIKADEINGFRAQILYNKTRYANRVAAGFNASGGPIKSGGGPMWFMSVGQKFSGGVYFKTALSRVIGGVS